MNEKADNGGPKLHTRSENHSEENLKKAAQNGESVDDIKGQLEEKEAEKQGGRRFGTFGDVFVPTLLTILGVIMFLRTGWVVGNAGLGGAWLIIAVSFLAKEFLSRLSEAARLPGNTKVLVADGDFGRFSSKAPSADINFFPLAERLDAKFMINMRDQTDSACRFSQDSGTESALA